MLKKITYKQATELLTKPDTFTEDDWDIVRAEALRNGIFRLGNDIYEIVEPCS